LRRLVIQQLGRLKDARAVPVLLALLEDVHHRIEVVEALGEIGDGRARGALIERLLGDGYVPVRLQAALALAKLGDSVAIPALETAAREDTEPSVVEAATNAALTLKAAL
jgi:HEAT repeat protein